MRTQVFDKRLNTGTILSGWQEFEPANLPRPKRGRDEPGLHAAPASVLLLCENFSGETGIRTTAAGAIQLLGYDEFSKRVSFRPTQAPLPILL